MTTRFDDIRAREAQYVLQTYKRQPVAFVRGRGAWLYDVTGKQYLDLVSGIGVTSLGHAHPGLARAQALMPADALERTFARYLDSVRKRDEPNSLYAYTPYEMRNVLTYVHLNQPKEANELLMNLLRHRRPAEWQVLAEVVYSDLRHAIYLGDMPHTWIGSEYARSIFGMLMHEADDHLALLPGAPPSWVAGDGLSVGALPTAYGPLTMTARRDGDHHGELRLPRHAHPRRLIFSSRSISSPGCPRCVSFPPSASRSRCSRQAANPPKRCHPPTPPPPRNRPTPTS